MRCFQLNCHSATDAGEQRHAQAVMRELSEKNGFRIHDSFPAPIADSWFFIIEGEPGALPSYVEENTKVMALWEEGVW